MKVRIIINTLEMASHGANEITRRTAEVWRGDMDILPHGEYLTKISIIADGQPQPICDVPFSPMVGYYRWIEPLMDDDEMERIEQLVIDEKKRHS